MGITAARGVEAAEPFEDVDLHRHSEMTRLPRNRTEEVVLKRLVLGARRCAAARVARVDAPRGSGIWLIEIERPEVCGLELHRYRATLTLALQRRRHNGANVRVERRRQLRHMKIRHVSPKESSFFRVERAGVGCARGLQTR